MITHDIPSSLVSISYFLTDHFELIFVLLHPLSPSLSLPSCTGGLAIRVQLPFTPAAGGSAPQDMSAKAVEMRARGKVMKDRDCAGG